MFVFYSCRILGMKPIESAIQEAGGPTRVSAALGVTVQAACFWRDGKRQFPERYGAALERLAPSYGQRWLIWPNDWQAIWPELATRADAPTPSVA